MDYNGRKTAAVPVKNFVSTRNACKLCAPLGASIAYRGIEGCIPLIHGSQGCSTYIRRYTISHFREPIDIASSNFTESTAIFGGRENLSTALNNITRQYKPEAIGITSTCLSETIGENVPLYLGEYICEREKERAKNPDIRAPAIFYASTPSYKGTHITGFHAALYAAVTGLVRPELLSDPERSDRINIISGFVSAEDLREVHEILRDYDVPYTLLPDYSKTLDGDSWEVYEKLPSGGTKISAIQAMGKACGSVYLGKAVARDNNAGLWLQENCGVLLHQVLLPVGIENTDAFFAALNAVTGRETPERWRYTRGRLVDAYIDGHKYCYGKRAIVYGDEDFVLSVCSFLGEIGIIPVLAATGAKALVEESGTDQELTVLSEDTDFTTMLETAKDLSPDIVIGNSKGFYLSRNLGIPLVRCSFPIHDRIGGQRILTLGYRGTLNLFDRVCNALMQVKQEKAGKGWSYV
ncbi:MAG: nitrogenase [Treponema sp.]|jgi:nitrogenase molybdenum-iron protein NifN|nr:nitrogenase [Treponema sp.]